MTELPIPVTTELGSAEYRNSDIAVDYVCDELLAYDLVITSVTDYDHTIVIKFTADDVTGELRINRIEGNFSLTVTGRITIIPTVGDWNQVRGLLCRLGQS